MKTGFLPCAVLCWALALVAPAGADDRILKFNPPDSVSFRLKTTSIRTDVRPDGPRVDTTVSKAEGKIIKSSSGWTMTSTLTSIEGFKVADSVKKMLSDLLIGIRTSLYINPQGRALRSSGYERVTARIDSLPPSPVNNIVRNVLTPEALNSRDITDWELRIGTLVGRPMRVGRIEPRPVDTSAGAERPLSFLSAVVFEDTVRLGKTLCLKVGIYSTTDPARMAEALHQTVGQVRSLYGLSDSTVARLEHQNVAFQSHLTLTVETATLLVRAEKFDRTMAVAVPGKDGMDTTRQTQETVEKAISYY